MIELRATAWHDRSPKWYVDGLCVGDAAKIDGTLKRLIRIELLAMQNLAWETRSSTIPHSIWAVWLGRWNALYHQCEAHGIDMQLTMEERW